MNQSTNVIIYLFLKKIDRLVAMSLLPIDHSTIKYGSMDAGSTVHTSDKRLVDMMKQAARTFFLCIFFVLF